MKQLKDPDAIIDALDSIYGGAVETLKASIERYIHEGVPPDGELRASRAFCYPELVIRYDPDGPPPPISRAYGKISEAGVYASTMTRPGFFREYLREQLTPLLNTYDVDVEVRQSSSEIPYTYVWDEAYANGSDLSSAELARWLPAPDLSLIGDEVADGELFAPGDHRPLALFDAQRVDFSLRRLVHYTGTRVEDMQPYVLFTNYHRYVDAFCKWAIEEIGKDNSYCALAAPGGVLIDGSETKEEAYAAIENGPWRRFQMPAYHLIRDDGPGITMVNIGVGPSNAKTITDHLAVLRPQCWLMVGHCGGLRHSQQIGDYVLAHAYLREDHVLDAVLPAEVPVPPIAEVQVALQEAAAEVTGEKGEALKKRLRTGTVVTTDDRNWELRFSATALRFNKSRAVAVDMESATIAANGYRLRVPYGVLLCVSDKPLHGELKLPGAANRFYERAIGEHIRIGIATLEKLSQDGAAKLHSRKLRAFDEPPFR